LKRLSGVSEYVRLGGGVSLREIGGHVMARGREKGSKLRGTGSHLSLFYALPSLQQRNQPAVLTQGRVLVGGPAVCGLSKKMFL